MSVKQNNLKSWYKSGAPGVWMSGGAVAIAIIMTLGLLAVIATRGLGHFWPADILEADYQVPGQEARALLGEVVQVEVRPSVTLEQASAPWSGGNRGAGATRLPLVTPDRQPGLRYAAVTVRDHGPGMDREHLPRLTERFYRVEGQKSGDRPGTGLGLSIVKHIVNRHRGGLTVESAPGQGSRFTAYFPVAASKKPSSAVGRGPRA